MITKKVEKKVNSKKEDTIIDIDIKKDTEKSNELSNMVKKLKLDKKLYFQIYDSLKGFDFIMSIIGKEKLVEYFVTYMKDTDFKQKNYSKFVKFIGENEGKEFIEDLRDAYNGIIANYDSIRFSSKGYHFGSEEVYLRETLNKIKSILEDLGELDGKMSFMKININFLGSSNSDMDLEFNDLNLEELLFYPNLEELNEETSEENLLPFFHLLNNLMEELKKTKERVYEISNDFLKDIQKDIDILYSRNSDKENEFIEKSKNEISTYLSKKDINSFSDMSSEVINILNVLERNKNLPQSILKRDIEILEESLESLKNVM